MGLSGASPGERDPHSGPSPAPPRPAQSGDPLPAGLGTQSARSISAREPAGSRNGPSRPHLTTVLSKADLASLWNVMTTLVAGRSTRHCFR